MSARDYLSLILDCRTIVRTLRRKFGAQRPPLTHRYVAGLGACVTDALHPSQLTVRVAAIRDETPSTRTLVVEAVGRPLPPYLPGQYVNIFTTVDGVRTSRPISISSDPDSGRLELTIKRKAGGFVSGHLLDNVQAGALLTISGPEGDFHHVSVRDGDDLVFIAAGTGVTPFIGLIEHTLRHRPRARALLLYGSRTPDEIIFFDRLCALARRDGRFEAVLTLSAPGAAWPGARGRIDAAFLRRHLAGGTPANRTYFVCGPPAMERAVERELERQGVPRERVRIETRRAAAPPRERAPTFSLRLEGCGEVLEVRADEPLMNSMERAGRPVPALCRSGSCGACRTKLVAGQVEAPARIGRRASDVSAGYIHPCVCHPTTDIVLKAPPDPGALQLRQSAWRPTLPPVEPPAAAPESTRLPASVRRPQLATALAAGGFVCLLSLLIYLVASSGVSL